MADAPPAPPTRGSKRSKPPRQAQKPGPLDGGPARKAATLLASRRVNRFGVIALASIIAGSLPLPWAIAGLGFGLLALVVGVMALIASLDARVKGSAVALLSVSLAIVGLLMLVQVLRVVVYPVSVAVQECETRALTDAAQQACDDDLPGSGGGFSFGR